MRKLILVAAALLAAGSAHAADFAAVLTGADGKPIPNCAEKTPECQRPTTLGEVASDALFLSYPDEATGPGAVSGDEKARRAALGLKVRDAGKLDLSAEDTALIKRLVGKAYAPIVVLRAYQLLDPASIKGDTTNP